jgi:hypothetical protein
VSLVSLSFAAYSFLVPSNFFFFFLFLPLLLLSTIWETRFFDVSSTPGAQIFTKGLFDLHKTKLSVRNPQEFFFFKKEKMEGREKIESYKKGCGFLGF